MHSLENGDGNNNSLIFANHTEQDILLAKEIRALAMSNPEKFKVHHCLSKGAEMKSLGGPNVTQQMCRITKESIQKSMPAPGPNTFITYCGPPMFERAVVGHLKALGYTQDMYMKHWHTVKLMAEIIVMR